MHRRHFSTGDDFHGIVTMFGDFTGGCVMDRIVSAFAFILAASGACAQDCQPIRFMPGESGAFIDGVLPAEGRDCYTLDVRRGQNVTVEVVGGSENVALTVVDVGDARRSFGFAAPSDRVEFLVFQLMRSATDADYSLLVQVQ